MELESQLSSLILKFLSFPWASYASLSFYLSSGSRMRFLLSFIRFSMFICTASISFCMRPRALNNERIKRKIVYLCAVVVVVGGGGTFHSCTSLKSFFNRMGGMISQCNSANNYRRLDPELEKKMVEAIKQRASSRRNSFKSINSIILRFPQYKEGLRTIKSVFEQYDEDSNGTIDRGELKKCLQKLRPHLTDKDIDDLYHSCDIDGHEGIQFTEFVVLLCLTYLLGKPATTPNNVSMTWSKLIDFMFNVPIFMVNHLYLMYMWDSSYFFDFLQTSMSGLPQLETTFETIVEAFLFLDNNCDGKVNKKDMIRALNDASPWEKSPGYITMKRFKEMDWHKNGRVSFKEFLFTFINWVGIDDDDEREIIVTD
ncbi:EF-hand domain-containing protein [Cinnamomum micranthum f. kanehirae]|uniref:EF-hand domain-containing protein n=1 Tax=Cinnamomum micranthum f. kanehirae TaxID=337451 RepID=A0A443P8X0_9MAGN|nr:EF-hand domain-containing protein [Cinnamomum micranthum f. kanehirae]